MTPHTKMKQNVKGKGGGHPTKEDGVLWVDGLSCRMSRGIFYLGNFSCSYETSEVLAHEHSNFRVKSNFFEMCTEEKLSIIAD